MGTFKRRGTEAFILLVTAVLLSISSAAYADETWNWGWSDMSANTGVYDYQSNGWVTINVTNNTSAAWGDFHISIFECTSFLCGAVDNVGFMEGTVDGMATPDSDRSSFTYVIDNANPTATLDYYYYNDPINVGQSGTFKVKVSNPDLVFFGVSAYPSIAPEPVSTTLFLIGGSLLGYRSFRRRRASR